MIKITDSYGRVHYLAEDSIASISDSSTNAKFNGIYCYVKCYDGRTFESRDAAESIASQIDKGTNLL